MAERRVKAPPVKPAKSFKAVPGPMRLLDHSAFGGMGTQSPGDWSMEASMRMEATMEDWLNGPHPDRAAALDLFAVGLRELAAECETEAKRVRFGGGTLG